MDLICAFLCVFLAMEHINGVKTREMKFVYMYIDAVAYVALAMAFLK